MANQLIGTIVSISVPQTLTSKSGTSFTKRDLVIAIQRFDPNTGQPVSDQSNTPQITFMNDKGAELNNYAVGQLVKVSIDVSGRQYTGHDGVTKIINDVRGYKIEPYGVQPYPQPTSADLQPQYRQPQGQISQQSYPQSVQPYPPAQVEYVQPEVVPQPPQSKGGDGLPF